AGAPRSTAPRTDRGARPDGHSGIPSRSPTRTTDPVPKIAVCNPTGIGAAELIRPSRNSGSRVPFRLGDPGAGPSPRRVHPVRCIWKMIEIHVIILATGLVIRPVTPTPGSGVLPEPDRRPTSLTGESTTQHPRRPRAHP